MNFEKTKNARFEIDQLMINQNFERSKQIKKTRKVIYYSLSTGKKKGFEFIT